MAAFALATCALWLSRGPLCTGCAGSLKVDVACCIWFSLGSTASILPTKIALHIQCWFPASGALIYAVHQPWQPRRVCVKGRSGPGPARRTVPPNPYKVYPVEGAVSILLHTGARAYSLGAGGPPFRPQTPIPHARPLRARCRI